MKNKIIKSLVIIIGILLMPLGNNIVSADSKEMFTSTKLDNFYIKKYRADGSAQYKKMSMFKRVSDGRFVYCVQPWVGLNESEEYDSIFTNQQAILNVSNEVWERLNLIAYYGYGYENHTDNRWYGITQLMIWKEVYPEGRFYFTKTLNGAVDNSYDWMRQEIENLIDNHYKTPNFTENNIKLTIGQKITLKDENNILDKFNIESSNDKLDVDINGNNLTITAKESGTTKLKFNRVFNQGIVDSVPILYNHESSQKLISRGNLNEISSYIDIESTGGKIKILKLDSKTKSCNTIKTPTLKGARYEITNSNNEVVETLIINNDCYQISSELKLGKYYIREIESPKGYKVDKNIYEVNITNSDIHEITIYEDLIENKISILKQYESNEENSYFLKGEGNIKFEIFDQENNKYMNILTDKNGYTIFNLPYGTWRIHQLNTKEGYKKVDDFYITVDEESNEEQYYNLIDKKISAYLKVIKIDSETGKTIEIKDTTFKILNLDTNQYVNQIVEGKSHDTFKTNEKGYMTTYLKLDYGNYKLIEVESPKNYLINNDGLNFKIDDNYIDTEYGPVVTLYFENTPMKGTLEIIKKDSSTNMILPNTKINLYLEDNTLIGEYITNEDGKIIIENLPIDKKMYIKEIEACNNSYILNNEKIFFEITENNQTVTLEILNEKKKSKIIIHKVDEDGNKVPGIVIGVYDLNDNKLFEEITDENGDIIKELEYGKYYYMEEKTLENLVLNKEKNFFEITENGIIYESTLVNNFVKVPDTLSNELNINACSIIMIILGLDVYYYGKYKKQK